MVENWQNIAEGKKGTYNPRDNYFWYLVLPELFVMHLYISVCGGNNV